MAHRDGDSVMATFRTEGIEKLLTDMDKWRQLPAQVVLDMVKAEADVFGKAQQRTAQSDLSVNPGTYYKGAVKAAVTVKEPRKLSNGAYSLITFKGQQHKVRLAEIAFINNFGRKRQVARPFIDNANKQDADKAVNAAEKVMNEYLDSIGL